LEDQEHRAHKDGAPKNLSTNDSKKIMEKDLMHRKRVGEMFGEGCLKSAHDYLNAALIYQHGDTPDHHYQAYIWANRAATIGNNNEKNEGKSMAATAIDRYLIKIGKKQLFGSQYFYDDSTAPCYCIEQVEKNFPDNLRRKQTNTSLHKRYEILASVFNKGKKCANAECRKTLKPTPKGSVPGLW
jgi:hypothetical protein